MPGKGIPTCPEWLLPEAKIEWERLVAVMDHKGVDDAAKNVKKGGKIIAFGVAIGVSIKEIRPKGSKCC